MAKPMAPVELPGLPTVMFAEPEPAAVPPAAPAPEPVAPREVQFLEMPSFEMPSGDSAGSGLPSQHRELDDSQRAAAQRLAERRDQKPSKHHNTMVPRMFVLAGGALGSFGPALWFIVAAFRGADVDTFAKGFVAMLLAGLTARGLGWLWWACAAAANAQNVRRGTISPLTAPLAYGTVFVALVLAVLVGGGPIAGVLVGLWALAVYIGVNAVYGGASSRLGGSSRFFNRLSWYPFAAGPALALANVVAGRLAPGSILLVVIAVVGPGLAAVLFVKFEQDAMGHFDRCCRGGSQMSAPTDETLEAFLKRNQVAASSTSVTS